MERILEKYLKGIVIRNNKQIEGSNKHIKYEAITKAATPEDVLDWKDCGNTISIVTKDGKKYSVPKDIIKPSKE